ncbi:MAG: hypothetical protein ABS78_00630 [Phenylobacterium sp. SCN 70-31]|nr:MAG: hypothetical protein ABS78_00630 [Phenylobacterium sp. SCN 70-31]
MRSEASRVVIHVLRHEGGWAAEFEGELFAYSLDKEISRAGALRRARTLFDAGRACQVTVQGETAFLRG